MKLRSLYSWSGSTQLVATNRRNSHWSSRPTPSFPTKTRSSAQDYRQLLPFTFHTVHYYSVVWLLVANLNPQTSSTQKIVWIKMVRIECEIHIFRIMMKYNDESTDVITHKNTIKTESWMSVWQAFVVMRPWLYFPSWDDAITFIHSMDANICF